MDAWIALARGPLFRISLAICVLGLLYRFALTLTQIVGMHRRAGDRRLPLATIMRSTVLWLLPVRTLRTNPVYGVASAAFHAGILLVPLFYVGHVNLWQ
jgi:nitrate reductase gamma subunit